MSCQHKWMIWIDREKGSKTLLCGKCFAGVASTLHKDHERFKSNCIACILEAKRELDREQERERTEPSRGVEWSEALGQFVEVRV